MAHTFLTSLQKRFPSAEIEMIWDPVAKAFDRKYLIHGKLYSKDQASKLKKKDIEPDAFAYAERKIRADLWILAKSLGGTDHKWSPTSNSIYFFVGGKKCRVSDHRHPPEKIYHIDKIISRGEVIKKYKDEYFTLNRRTYAGV